MSFKIGMSVTAIILSSFLLGGCYKVAVQDDLALSNPDLDKIEAQLQASQQGENMDQPTDLPTNINEFERQEQQAGSGELAKAGDTITVHYTGYLLDGSVFDTSYKRGQPFSFELGQGRVIRGWDEGLVGVQAGGQYRLLIPSDWGYGPTGSPPVIPANAALVFDVEVISIN